MSKTQGLTNASSLTPKPPRFCVTRYAALYHKSISGLSAGDLSVSHPKERYAAPLLG